MISAGVRLPAFADLPVRPWFLAPPRRLPLFRDAQTLTLHTFQTREAYETLAADGVLVGDSSRGWHEFQEAYGWMLRQMDERGVHGPAGGLLWLWAGITTRQLRDDARRARGHVLLTVRVPRDRVLISEFSDWHAALNRFLHVPARPGESPDAWERRWTALDDDFRARATPYERLPIDEWPQSIRTEIEASWEAIFDPATWSAKASLQATMRELRAPDVVRAVRIR